MKTLSKAFGGRFDRLRKSGFALIATLMMLILLLLLAVGIQSVSAISLRSAKQSDAMMQAQANARMALMIAIGELQKQMGPDQRISANGDILDADSSNVQNRQWLGVWNSWKAGPGETSQHRTIQGVDDLMAPTYQPNREDYFRKWLVSLDPGEASQISSAKNLDLAGVRYPVLTDNAVRLVGEGSLGTDVMPADYVSARLMKIMDDRDSELIKGRYGWWVGDESQKARIMDDAYRTDPPVTSAEKISRAQAPGSMATKMLEGLDGVSDESQFAKLPSLKTLDLVPNVKGRPAQINFHHASPFTYSVIADVREGGLKRDLNAILELPIDRNNTSDPYMLYAFDDARFPGDRAHSRVPIQDLAAYYQLYDHEPAFANQRREGVQYTSATLPNTLQVRAPDFDGNTKNRQRVLREYTALYRQPVITKVQFLVAITADPVTAAERQWVLDRYNQAVLDRAKSPPGPLASSRIVPMRDTDTHKMRMGILPMVTLWNPNNVSMVMDTPQVLRFDAPAFGFRFRKYRTDGAVVDMNWSNLSYAAGNNFGGATTGQASGFALMGLRFARAGAPVTFQPGEVKVFSLPASTGTTLNNSGGAVLLVGSDTTLNTVNQWDPSGFFLMQNSTPCGAYEDEAPDAYGFQLTTADRNQSLVFNPDDRITFSIDTENPAAVAANNWRDGRVVSTTRSMAPQGSAFSLYMMDENYQIRWQDNFDHLRHYTMVTRYGNLNNALRGQIAQFNLDLLKPGFPGGTAPIAFDSSVNAIPGSQLIAAAGAGEVISLMEFSLNLGCEAGTASTGGFGGGRRIMTRPFLHAPLTAAPFIDQSDKASLYNYGWDWRLGRVNTVEDSVITAKPNTGNGFFGGGYTVESGTTHVVQRQIPVLPIISMASLSHAHLGGFSLGYHMSIGNNPETDTYFKRSALLQGPTPGEYQRVTAYGQAGLAPHVTQAIGNSYAHPNIPADKAFVMKQRHFDADVGPVQAPFVDHSYLANKALWDEFFFSSITPQPAKVELYGSTSSLTAKQVAEKFFLENEPLPNRRIIPYGNELQQQDLDELFNESAIFTNGLADKIAAHLMVQGAFNINSTSVEAWKILLQSLRGKAVPYLATGKVPTEATPAGTVVGAGFLSNAQPIETSEISDLNTPAEQWTAGRELTDTEIDELANAIVKQVKLRGPFLSMSEFVNRRLQASNNTNALKGALQAALDDEDVSINAAFRTSSRIMDAESAGVTFDFPDAAKGPVAYGSQAYVDQADILQGLAEQLTPRGDTFLIRTYGDALDKNGKVIARAWCEAVVQRTPEYIDPADESHTMQADLSSEANREFGRKLQVTGFRWLNSKEI